MNDRFKFRAEYVYRGKTGLVYFSIDDLLNINHDSLDGDDYLITIHDPTTKEQCTGLKDKNGRLIYEGDIVSLAYYDKPYQVYWDNLRLCFAIKNGDIFAPCVTDMFDVEVIGNIHNNPELLK